ncbi:hypothetical protein PFISCL1PPCAC_27864, partial [Pristionchus fissidentatus]
KKKEDEEREERDVKIFPCSVCDREFEVAGGLLLHLRIHKKCEICMTYFISAVELARHKQAEHGEASTSSIAPMLTTKRGRGRPRKNPVPGGGTPSAIDISPVKYTSAANTPLTPRYRNRPSKNPAEEKSELREKKYECSTCGHKFAGKKALYGHSLCHTGDRPFKCAVCGMGFVTQSLVKDHMRSIHNSLPYSCRHCKTDFAKKSEEVSHRAICIAAGARKRRRTK